MAQLTPEYCGRRRRFLFDARNFFFAAGLDAMGINLPANPLEHLSPEALSILSLVEEIKLANQGGEAVLSVGENNLGKNYCDRIVTDLEAGSAQFADPKVIILHWDGAPRRNRRAINTVYGLNDPTAGQQKSVHFCVDDTRLGILQTMPIPIVRRRPLAYKGIHLMASTQNPQIGRTLDRQASLLDGSTYQDHFSALHDLHNGRGRELNLFSVGIESVGERFSFASLPPERQTANMVSAVIFLMRTYNIPLWLVFGHHEVQEGKVDVGDEYACLVRHLVAYYAITLRDENLLSLVLRNPQGRTARELTQEFNASPVAAYSESLLDERADTLSSLLNAG